MKQYKSVFELIDDKNSISGFVDLNLSCGYFIKNDLNLLVRHGLIGGVIFQTIVFFWKDEKLK